jgi:hypothetical protein
MSSRCRSFWRQSREQYRFRPIFSVVPHERHRFGSFPSATGTGNAFMAFVILPSTAVALSALTGEKIAGPPYHRMQKKGKRDPSHGGGSDHHCD